MAKHYDRGGPYEREYDDNLPVLRWIANAIDTGALNNPVSPMSGMLGPYIKEGVAGAASQNMGVDRDTGKVGIGQGGVTGIGAINDTKAFGAFGSKYAPDDPRNPGYQSMRMQDALEHEMNLSPEPGVLERLANMTGAIAGQFPAWLFSDGASTPAVLGSTLSQISKFAKPAMELAERAPSALRTAGRAANTALEFATPVNNVGIKPQHLIPAVGIGEGVNQGIDAAITHENPRARLQVEITKEFGSPEEFAHALANWDPRAKRIEEEYRRIYAIEDAQRNHMTFPRGRWEE